MRYGFINNFSQTLAAELAQGATTMTLDDGGALLDNASAEMVYTLTLFDVTSGENEIVHVTAASGNDLTVERGKEGTTDRAWPTGTQVEMRLTAGVLEHIYQEEEAPLQIVGSDNLIGHESYYGSGVDSGDLFGNVVLGVYAGLGDDVWMNTVIGYSAFVDDKNTVVLGCNTGAYAGAESAVVIGDSSTTGAEACIVVGTAAHGYNKNSVTIGRQAGGDGEASVVIGIGAKTTVAGGLRIHALPHLPKEAKDETNPGFQNSVVFGVANSVPRSSFLTAIATDAVDLTDSEDSFTLELPGSTFFLVDAVDIVIVEADGAGGDPEIIIGPDDQDPDAYLDATPVTKTAVGGRETHDPLTHDGVTSLRVAVDTAGTGTYKAKIVFRGYVMEV